MDQLFEILFQLVDGTLAGQILTLLALASFILTHVAPHLPPSLTEKVPNWLMIIVNSLAGQYRHAANAETDIQGNPRTSDKQSSFEGTINQRTE